MEIWHALTGHIDRKEVQDSIRWINDEIYSKPIVRLRFLLGSRSGEISAGIGLYTYLRALPIEVETIAFGEVDVVAALIFLAGSRRLAVEGCQFFFREGRYAIQDAPASVRQLEDALSVYKREQQEMVYILARETGNDTEVVSHMLERSKIMQASEALEFGLSHETVKKLPLSQQERFGFRDNASHDPV